MVELPPFLARRRLQAPEPREGALVVVWLRVAVRGHENPVLDAGRLAAAALGLPLLVYHAVSERYPHASDRHHAFILQGARDLADELDALGISAAFHVERPGHRGPVLKQLAERAALVVTDHMPLDPLRRWTERLAADVPVWALDASCIAPVTLGSRPTRAFRFRDDTDRHRDRFEWPWPEVSVTPARYEGPFPFAPVDVRTADLSALIGACEIDHTVGPVHDTPGGSRAGYARWAAFRDTDLAAYPRRRNDPAKPDGVSRMSAYLHYGHVSPWRIARDAAARGASKFLDELLVWREIAWHLCHHVPDARSVDALPSWARATLDAHAEDPRDVLPLEALDAGRTGDPLWDTAQRSLLRHGELHNNVRMTWGKAVLPWSRGPRQALARLFELNDRYALDGRDPASVGGITWCLGQLDRPFTPEQPVIGALRPRPTRDHAARLDLDTWSAHVDRPVSDLRVLVIGAGISGSAAAHALHRAGLDVSVVDKARGPGGRLTSRRSDVGRFDHGAGSFTARDPRFLRQLLVWQAAGLVAPWAPRLARWDGGFAPDTPVSPRWVVRGRSSALASHLLDDLPFRPQTRITGLERVPSGWIVHHDGGSEAFDRVVLTAPGPQMRELVTPVSPALGAALEDVRYTPCWAAMVTGGAGLAFDAVRFAEGEVSWMVRQDTLPDRDGPERWVLHARADASEAQLEREPDARAAELGRWFAEHTGHAPLDVQAHRWRYARVDRPLGVDIAHDGGLILAGDALRGGRVEDAWLSGCAAAGHVLREVGLAHPSGGLPT
ncbi:MAG: NAD(P)-binding protein [Myxococcota bacterium]